MGLIVPICWLLASLTAMVLAFVAFDRNLKLKRDRLDRDDKTVAELSEQIGKLENRLNKHMVNHR